MNNDTLDKGDTIDEKIESCFDDLVISSSGNYIAITFGDKTINVDYEHFLAFGKRIKSLIQSETKKARIDENNRIREKLVYKINRTGGIVKQNFINFAENIADRESELKAQKKGNQ